MKDWLLRQVVRLHRALLVLGTVALAVAGSRVASSPGEVPSWGVILGGAILLVVADVAREFDIHARELARNASTVKYNAALSDLLDARGSKNLVTGLYLAGAATLGGFFWEVLVRIGLLPW